MAKNICDHINGPMPGAVYANGQPASGRCGAPPTVHVPPAQLPPPPSQNQPPGQFNPPPAFSPPPPSMKQPPSFIPPGQYGPPTQFNPPGQQTPPPPSELDCPPCETGLPRGPNCPPCEVPQPTGLTASPPPPVAQPYTPPAPSIGPVPGLRGLPPAQANMLRLSLRMSPEIAPRKPVIR